MNNKNLRQGIVYYKDEQAGYLTETNKVYTFLYDKDFIKRNIPISISMPPREEPYESRELFPFFQGLLPEGWYLDLVTATQKIDARDSFGILLSTTNTDTIGAVTIRRVFPGKI